MEVVEQIVVGISPPPRKDDVLFGSGVDWQTNACVNGVGDAMAYQDGYRRGALYLAERVCDEGRGQDFLIYPIVYLYRHHIELVLKSIVKSAASVTDYKLAGKEIDALGRHDLSRLWGIAKLLLGNVCELSKEGPLPPADLDGIDSYIAQLHKYDPDGQRFRYSYLRSKKSKNERMRSLNPDLVRINIRNLAINIEKLCDYLEALDLWIDDLLDAKRQYSLNFV